MQSGWYLKEFHELSLEELYEILKLREIVFIIEQDCPYNDLDGLDEIAHHLCHWSSGKLTAYTRIFKPGVSYEQYASIGRVVVNEPFRGTGLGVELMELSVQHCKQMYPDSQIKISAQCYLERFYKSLGFMPTGEEYLEDGIPHQGMLMP